MSCLDQIFFFPGEKMECRKSGLMTMGNSCCKNKDEATESCGFENLAGELGLDDIALTALSVGNTINNLSGLTGASLSEMAAKAIAESVVETWIKEGTVEGVAASLTKLFGGEFAEAALGGLEELLFEQGAEFVMQELAKEAAVTGGAKVVTTAAISAVASAIASMINIIGIIYAIYQVYNLMSQLAECTPGELMLACRRAKHVCHKVGSRCKIKVFGACLQDMEVYCCFNTQLAKVIHEQGRPQIGMGWGSGKKPLCRGFYADEFVSLDFGRMDFSEYANELTRQMSNNIGPDIEKAMRKAMDNFGLQ
ncbi:MAG: conjugal transfer protein TraN [Desulfovibrio sp.]|nr:conjugal transfer protein TraN [Desulfovibrio sp.]